MSVWGDSSMRKALLPSLIIGILIGSACDSSAVNSSAPGLAPPPASMAARGQNAVSRAMRTCIADVTARDPALDARRDAEAGERRLFAPQSDPATFLEAPGLAGCTLPLEGEVPQRPGFFDRYDFHDDRGRADLRAECGLAIRNYRGAYNRALAAIAPDSIARSCIRGRGRIDPTYRPVDLEEFRTRMRRMYGE